MEGAAAALSGLATSSRRRPVGQGGNVSSTLRRTTRARNWQNHPILPRAPGVSMHYLDRTVAPCIESDITELRQQLPLPVAVAPVGSKLILSDYLKRVTRLKPYKPRRSASIAPA